MCPIKKSAVFRKIGVPECAPSRFFIGTAVLSFLFSVSLPLFAQTELGVKDDLTVLGTNGTALDPNTEIKGFTVFGATQAAYPGAVIGPGNVVVNGALAVSSGAYFAGVSTFSTGMYVMSAASFTDVANIYITGGADNQVLAKNGAAGPLKWSSSSALGDNLGNHTATQALNMAGNQIMNVSTLTVNGNAFSVGGSTLAVLAGNVGIGTAAPGAKLELGSGQLFVPTGSAAAPSYSFTGGGNVGIYKSGANEISFAVSGTQIFKMDGNGNLVGVGGAALVSGTSKGFNITGQAGSAAAPIYSFVGDADNGIFSSAADNLNFATSGAERLRVDPSGNVGVSTGAPQARLDVLSAGSAPTDMATIWRKGDGSIVSSMSATGVMMAAKFIGDGSGLSGVLTAGDNLGNHTATQDLKMANYNIVNVGSITVNNAATFYSSMTVNGGAAIGLNAVAAGNNSIAIGPSAAASASYTLAIGNGAFTNFNSYATAIGHTANGRADSSVAIGDHTTSDSYAQIVVGRYNMPTGTETTGSWVVTDPLFTVGNGTGAAASRSNAMMILKNGNVGISTSAPQARLDVVAAGSAQTDMAQIWRNSGGTIVSSMSATGVMMATKFIGDGSGLSGVMTAGDNLGNHVATQNLVMGSNWISNDGGAGEGLQFDTSGNANFSGNAVLGSAAQNNAALTLRGPNAPTNQNSAQDLRFSFSSAGSSAVRAYRGGSWDTYLQFLTNSSAQGADLPQVRMHISGAGDVGISTGAPQARLDVLAGGSTAADMAQIWRKGDGTVVSSMSATGVMMATKFIGDGSGLINVPVGAAASANYLTYRDLRTIAPSSESGGTMRFGFTSFANNNSAPYADYLHLRSYTDATGGSDNLVLFRKDTIGLRIWQQAWGSATAYSAYKDMAFTDGTNATGSWPISITGTSAGGPPSGAAGGNLGGTYPNPSIASLPAISGAALTSLTGANVTGVVPAATRLDSSGQYIWASATLAQNLPVGITNSFVQAADGWPSYGTLINARSYASGGGGGMQLYAPYGSSYGGTALKYRTADYTADSVNPPWTAFKTLLDSGNFNSYAPTLTGTGASGSWPISITGTSAGAAPTGTAGGNLSGTYPNPSIASLPAISGAALTNLTAANISAGTAGISVTGNAATATKLNSQGNYAAAAPGTTRGPAGLNMFEVYTNGYPIPYGNVLHMSGGGAGQLLVGWSGTDGANADNYVRSKRDNDAGAWSPWAKILTDVNFNSYAPTLTGTGASGSWPISITGTSAGAAPTGTAGGNLSGTYPNPSIASLPAISGAALTSLTGANVTGTVPSATNADKVDGYHASTLNFFQSDRDFPLGTLIQSDIDYSVTNGEPFLLELDGNSYGSLIPFEIKVQGYIYSNTIINYGGISNGTNLAGLVAFNYLGKLCFWFPNQAYWQGFSVNINDSYGGVKKNRLVSVANSAKPGGTTKEVAFTIQQSLHSGNYNSYAPTLTGGGASGSWPISITGTSAGAAPSGAAGGVLSGTYPNPGLAANISVTGSVTAATYLFPPPTGDPTPVITARIVPAGQGAANEKTELILFHSNDNANGSGVDQITLRAPALSFQTYNDASVSDINNVLGYNERLTISPTGAVNIPGSLTVGGTLTGTVANSTYHVFQQHTNDWVADFNSVPASSRGWAEQSAGGPQGTWWFMDNMRHSNASNYWGTQVAWGWEDNANQLWQRNVTGGSWSGWVKYLNSGNFNNYAPTLTGTGASGTWPISVTGSVGSANLVNGTYTGSGGLQPPSYIPNGQVRFNMMTGVPGTAGGYQDWLMMDTYTGGDVPYVTMIGVSKTAGAPVGYLAVGAKGGATWAATPIITGNNIGSQSVSYAATAGSAGTITGGKTGKETRLYRSDAETSYGYYLRHYWTANTNGWRLTASNDVADEQANIHRVSVDQADNSDTVDGYHGVVNQAGSRYASDYNSLLNTGFYNGESTPANAPNAYGQLITAKGIDTGLQIAGGYSSDNLYFRGWWSSGGGFSPWRTVIHSGNIASQTVANLTAGATPTLGSLTFSGVGGDSGQPGPGSDYRIYQAPGAWTYPFPDLNIAWHTGISIGAHYNYGGTRFFNNSDMITLLMSVGNGDNHVRVTNNLLVSGNLGVGQGTPNGRLDISNNGGSDGTVIYQDVDNTETIQTYIDGQWAARTTYAGACCNGLKLQPDAGYVTIGGGLTVTANASGSGSVGIGAAPAAGYALDVVGKIRATVGQGLYSISGACPGGGSMSWSSTCNTAACRGNWWATYYVDCGGACPYSSATRSSQTCGNTLLGRMLSP